MAERTKGKMDDKTLWKAVVKDVKPLKRRPLSRSANATGNEFPEQIESSPKEETQRGKTSAPTRPKAAPGPSRRELSHGQAPDVDKRTLDRLRRGRLPIEAEIDLHGHSLEEAHRVLSAFIIGHAAAGRRCVRVITGKGRYREGGGVLKTEVPRWLNEPGLNDRVLAFTHARRDDGGEGALYVLLRRKRPRRIG
jgi:DNA-nicking Smr family endonuclease